MTPSGYAERPDYRVDLLARRNLVSAWDGEVLLAQSTRTLLVDEQDHGLVFYFPRADVRLDRLVAVDHQSYCPFKGTASYWTVTREGVEKVAWSYEDPYPEVARLKDHIAFYHDRIRVVVGEAERSVPRR